MKDSFLEVFETIMTIVDIFNNPIIGNYVSYSAHFKANKKAVNKVSIKKVNKEVFSDFIKKNVLDKITEPSEADALIIEDIRLRMELGTYMPKQVDVNNRVIPYQLYGYEFKKILLTASNYLPFLNEKDSDNLSNIDKLLSIFTFRVPYFVGPLNPHSSFAWLKRDNGKIFPWNFNKIVDLDESENNLFAE